MFGCEALTANVRSVKMGIMSRTRVRRRRRLLGSMGVAAVGWLALHGHAANQATQPVARHVYVVRNGDTLWSIAGRVAGESRDPRPVVDQIARANGITAGDLVPGQTLEIP